MDKKYNDNVKILKSLSDMNRLIIIEMISNDELCACKILEKIGVTQPTLSHHMKILCNCGLVNCRKEGKWMYYSLNTAVANDFLLFIKNIIS